MPVVFKPIPPDFLAKPRREMERPTMGFLSQISQCHIEAHYSDEFLLGKEIFMLYTQTLSPLVEPEGLKKYEKYII